MEFADNEILLDGIEELLHLDTQQEYDHALDLTAGAIYQLTTPGALDFGGSEFEEAGREEIVPQKQSPDDDYGWWNLDAGTYLVEFNESLNLNAGQFAFIQPHDRLIKAGAHHASTFTQGTRDTMMIVLQVGEQGIRIKENARVSTMFLVQNY